MLQVLHVVPVLTAIRAVPVVPVNGMTPADAATELENDLDWWMANN